ncbi:Gfo/Idh/MocA family protein [Rhodococcus rhodochrous]|uniref:Gfo/Idh/MocA family protein n=1 Tax=Rhodococcus rhodochrous TaxID=1829 RepID=UPI001E2FB969|nr:Gfo/Idh/MocA family oxidoreductase [Rhodococcus rhodochrous]MCD2100281.1 Gfo/Idh/MocA family oxidoreductase [Rhodococcus rhodochrous]MCD2124639.1 Gfo/Idh/MocA family oxidoreductase [Rhodococcus rhodochrous]MCQ4137810.1 Gfo/Idh/MocA family oxidoreductase [Rhodococcus rhodochrous]MDJ0021435.1 Gfo/Idh/MocA family oxidoreductase [Rhodococcus rhodochrous]
MEPIVVGLLGITHPHASARVRALRQIDGVEVIAAADDDPRLKYFTDKYDMEAREIDEVLQDDRINAIMVHSKSKDMVAHARRALDAGKSVVVEKPGGGTVDDLLALAEAEASAAPGLVVQVGFNVRLAESITQAKELIDAGVIGEVVTVSARGAALVGEHLTQHLNQPADMGGALWIIGCHMLDSLVHMFGAPESVNARVHKSPRLSDERSREDSASVLLNYSDMSITFSFDGHDHLEWFESSRISIYGTGGMIEVGILPQRLRVYVDEDRGGYKAGWTEWTQSHFTPPFARTELNKFSELPELENISNFHPEMRGWVESIRTGAPVVAPVADALTVARIVDACYRSERNRGASIDLPSA